MGRKKDRSRIRKWRWMDSSGFWWVANQPLNWAEKMKKDGYKVFPYYKWKR